MYNRKPIIDMKTQKSVTINGCSVVYSITIKVQLPPVMFCLDQKCIVVNSNNRLSSAHQQKSREKVGIKIWKK